MRIALDVMSAFASQDVAVSVAFLVTEIVEMAMECDTAGGVTIRLVPADDPRKAKLTITAPGLASAACRNHGAIERFDRVIEGLSRQLRARPERDEERGVFAIAIPVIAVDGAEG